MNEKILEDYSRYCIIAMVFGLSVSTAGANFALAGFLVFATLSNKLREDFLLIIKNPITISSLILFFTLCLSVLWSEANASIAWQWVSKYKKLLLIPLAAPFFQERVHKILFLRCAVFSLSLGLFISYFNYFGITSIGNCPSIGCSTHTYITLSMLNCLLLIILLAHLIFSQKLMSKPVMIILASLSLINISWILSSRTGQLMVLSIAAGAPLLIWRSREYSGGNKNLLIYAIFIIGFVIVGVGAIKGSRLSESIQKLVIYKEDALKSTDSSVAVDVRSEMYRKTFVLIAERPLLGWGAGGQEETLISMSGQGVTANERYIFANPHNEYLSWTVQTGVIGLIVFMCWLLVVWRQALRIGNSIEKAILLGWLLIFTLGSLFNSFLLDFAEGYMTVLLIAVLAPTKIGDENAIVARA